MKQYPVCRLLIVLCVFVGGFFSAAQAQGTPNLPSSGNRTSNALTQTAAYAEIALKRAEMQADLESLLLDYTDDFPRVKELKFALGRVKVESDRLMAVPPAEKEKATSALGKLVVRKIEAEIELWKLQQNYAEGHPEVKRARKRVEVFENAIKEILG